MLTNFSFIEDNFQNKQTIPKLFTLIMGFDEAKTYNQSNKIFFFFTVHKDLFFTHMYLKEVHHCEMKQLLHKNCIS